MYWINCHLVKKNDSDLDNRTVFLKIFDCKLILSGQTMLMIFLKYQLHAKEELCLKL